MGRGSMTASGLRVTTIGTWSHSWEGSGVSQEDTMVERVVFANSRSSTIVLKLYQTENECTPMRY